MFWTMRLDGYNDEKGGKKGYIIETILLIRMLLFIEFPKERRVRSGHASTA